MSHLLWNRYIQNTYVAEIPTSMVSLRIRSMFVSLMAKHFTTGLHSCSHCAHCLFWNHRGASNACLDCEDANTKAFFETNSVDCPEQRDVCNRCLALVGGCVACGADGTVASDKVCSKCSAGQALKGSGTACEPCGPGTVSNGTLLECTQCDPGSVPNAAQDECAECKSNEITDNGQRRCVACPAGSVPDTVQRDVCNVCVEGEITVDGQTECRACQEGLVPNAARVECVCPVGEHSVDGVCTLCAESCGHLCDKATGECNGGSVAVEITVELGEGAELPPLEDLKSKLQEIMDSAGYYSSNMTVTVDGNVVLIQLQTNTEIWDKIQNKDAGVVLVDADKRCVLFCRGKLASTSLVRLSIGGSAGRRAVQLTALLFATAMSLLRGGVF